MPACMYLATCSTAATTYDISGSRVLRSGVGTQMFTVSRPARTEASVVARSRPSATNAATSAVGTSGM